MSRLLVLLLVLATLTGNAAWAVDRHLDAAGHHAGSELVGGDHHPADGDDTVCADHCGHGLAHLLALHPDAPRVASAPDGGADFAYLDRLTTHTPAAPIEPPRA